MLSNSNVLVILSIVLPDVKFIIDLPSISECICVSCMLYNIVIADVMLCYNYVLTKSLWHKQLVPKLHFNFAAG